LVGADPAGRQVERRVEVTVADHPAPMAVEHPVFELEAGIGFLSAVRACLGGPCRREDFDGPADLAALVFQVVQPRPPRGVGDVASEFLVGHQVLDAEVFHADLVERPGDSPGGAVVMVSAAAGQFQAEREEAWTEILQWVMEQERWPSLILNQWVFQRPHKWLTRRMIYANGRTDLPEGNFEDLASEAHNLAEKHLSEIRLVYDETGDGLRSDAIDGTQKMGQTLMLGAYHNRNHSPTTTGGGLW
jgi:hypothetical protein